MWIMNCMWYCTFISKLAYQLGNIWTRDHRPARSVRLIRLVIDAPADNDYDVVSVSLLSQCNVYSENIDQTTQFIARVMRLGAAADDDDDDNDDDCCLPASINLFDESELSFSVLLFSFFDFLFAICCSQGRGNTYLRSNFILILTLYLIPWLSVMAKWLYQQEPRSFCTTLFF